METTVSKLNIDIKQRLKGIVDYETIQINEKLGQFLDTCSLPEKAKLACLTIDTSMKHLDDISNNRLSKHSILVGDLLSAHFYTILAEINDPEYQLAMSKAIVEVSELKSSLHQHVLTDEEASDAIFKIETLFPYITLTHFNNEGNATQIYDFLYDEVHDYYPSYLKNYNKERVNLIMKDIKQTLDKRRGN
ncbi:MULTISPECIES: heptaprenyl pyrophosphate synthase subunit A [Staphylococcus]|uniref:heptaprenyl pyrophosphate synthase subunit A n=1 Tax=Staphylococcus TaxID=1279 RepID=UPI0002F2A99E|nr:MULTISPECIES: heptaprenyl pyrophosphate synthase subunit A [Staphylococcus]MBM6507365.1 heptaprenyl pyrophosphate synthase subunit A [Staphylococcus pasteuri]PTU83219.1 heptaprenyl pyrophosphate synthase subunit A [Staphylococcus pasteuri]PTU86266.1 heptaprenyl pyrophosphate synthase subunit A [Staphylococcus pasteuri]QQT20883.1 heptaprenyl pyrophosphate synthase subunit A [Staphylococcus pasteuri]RIO37814.1 heptaprenyl pyrophosphate synthase subunit A [Staphylococcus pasteuri]